MEFNFLDVKLDQDFTTDLGIISSITVTLFDNKIL